MKFVPGFVFFVFLGEMIFPNVAQNMDLMQLAESLGAKILVNYLVESGLDTALSSSGPFTVFAPTDDAFITLSTKVKAVLGKDPDLLRRVLQYHVADGITYSNKLYNDLLVPSLAQDLNIRVNTYYKKPAGSTNVSKIMTVNGAELTLADQNATNGVVHVIDQVMFPVPLGAVPQVVGDEPDLSSLLYAIAQANLTDILNGDGPFTVFAPSNAAFERLPADKLNELLGNQSRLEHILRYHVIPGTYYKKGLATGFRRTLYRSYVRITEGTDSLYVNHAEVIKADIPTTNGVIHIIDKVLIPRIC